jgi:hypothetical protein
MHPFKCEQWLNSYGFWLTFWTLREEQKMGRGAALWLIWVAARTSAHRAALHDF